MGFKIRKEQKLGDKKEDLDRLKQKLSGLRRKQRRVAHAAKRRVEFA